jgi:hypothetical protein
MIWRCGVIIVISEFAVSGSDLEYFLEFTCVFRQLLK